MTPLRRHALVWLSQTPQPDVADDADAVASWQAEGHPFVVCRQRGGADRVSLGFCLASPVQRARRIAVQASPDQIARIARPPSLSEVTASAAAKPSREVVAGFKRLANASRNEGLDIRVFGSWMWQMLTGEPHVTATSDLDLLIDADSRSEADRAAAFLQREEPHLPFRLDGEISLPAQGEIHWKEYLRNQPQILVKSLHAVRMIPREELWK